MNTNQNLTAELANSYGLTLGSLQYFAVLAKDAGDWSGIPMVTIEDHRRLGYLTALKKAALIVTEQDEWNGRCRPVWAHFTARGAALAAEIGWTDIEATA